MNDVLSAVMEIHLCGLLSSKKESFSGFAPKGLHHRHAGVPYWTDPSAVSPMCVFDLLDAICHNGKNSVLFSHFDTAWLQFGKEERQKKRKKI